MIWDNFSTFRANYYTDLRYMRVHSARIFADIGGGGGGGMASEMFGTVGS